MLSGDWRTLHNNSYQIMLIKSRRMRWAWHVAHMGEGRGVYGVLVGKPEGRRPLGRPRRRWEDNIRMDLREMEWINVAQYRDKFSWDLIRPLGSLDETYKTSSIAGWLTSNEQDGEVLAIPRGRLGN